MISQLHYNRLLYITQIRIELREQNVVPHKGVKPTKFYEVRKWLASFDSILGTISKFKWARKQMYRGKRDQNNLCLSPLVCIDVVCIWNLSMQDYIRGGIGWILIYRSFYGLINRIHLGEGRDTAAAVVARLACFIYIRLLDVLWATL